MTRLSVRRARGIKETTSNGSKKLQLKVAKLYKAIKYGNKPALFELQQLMEQDSRVARIVEALSSFDRSGSLGRNIHTKTKLKSTYLKATQGGAPGLIQQHKR